MKQTKHYLVEQSKPGIKSFECGCKMENFNKMKLVKCFISSQN